MRVLSAGSLIAALLLSGCGLAPLSREASPIATAAQPAYYVSRQGRLTPRACRAEPRGGFGGVPPGCARDVAVLAQVADPADVLHPRAAGPTPAARVARAAETYIYGDEAGPVTVTPRDRGGVPATNIPPGPDAAP